jgi:hypothetical protein
LEARIFKDIPSLEKGPFHDAADLHVPQSSHYMLRDYPVAGKFLSELREREQRLGSSRGE